MLNYIGPPLFTLLINNNQTLLAATPATYIDHHHNVVTFSWLRNIMWSFVAYLFLCFSLMHACSARPLGMFDDNKENGLGLLISANKSVEEKLQVENGASISLVNGDGAVSMAETIEAFKKIDDQEDKGGNDEVATFSLQEFLHEKLEIKGSQKRARSTLESLTAPSAEEDVAPTGDNDHVEDAVVMDYAQPHRKPPIHNR